MDFKMADTSERGVFCNTILLKYHGVDSTPLPPIKTNVNLIHYNNLFVVSIPHFIISHL